MSSGRSCVRCDVPEKDRLSAWVVAYLLDNPGADLTATLAGGDAAPLLGESVPDVPHRQRRADVLELRPERQRSHPDGRTRAAEFGESRVRAPDARDHRPPHLSRRRRWPRRCSTIRSIPSAPPISHALPTAKAGSSCTASIASMRASPAMPRWNWRLEGDRVGAAESGDDRALGAPRCAAARTRRISRGAFALAKPLTDEDVSALYDKYSVERFSLNDRGYLARCTRWSYGCSRISRRIRTRRSRKW